MARLTKEILDPQGTSDAGYAGMVNCEANRQDLCGCEHERSGKNTRNNLFAASGTARTNISTIERERTRRRLPGRFRDTHGCDRLEKTGDLCSDILSDQIDLTPFQQQADQNSGKGDAENHSNEFDYLVGSRTRCFLSQYELLTRRLAEGLKS